MIGFRVRALATGLGFTVRYRVYIGTDSILYSFVVSPGLKVKKLE